MKKKIIALCLVISLLAIAIVGSTLAYFTDTDEAENVFTVGDVRIQINEEFNPDQIDENGNLILRTPGLKNEVKKFVSVENIGKNDAFIRVIISIPAELDPVLNLRLANAAIQPNNSDPNSPWYLDYNAIKENAETGMLDYVFYLKEPLEAGKETIRLLSFVDLSSKFDWVDDGAGWTDGEKVYYTTPEFKVVVKAEAIQADNFNKDNNNDGYCFDEAFAAFDSQNTAAKSTATVVTNASELQDAIDNATKPTVLKIKGTVTSSQIVVDSTKDITIIGADSSAKFDGQFKVTGNLTLKNLKVTNASATTEGISKLVNNAVYVQDEGILTCENVTFDITKGTGITTWWSSASTNPSAKWNNVILKNCDFNCNSNRALQIEGNATIEGCTFNAPYRYAAQLTCGNVNSETVVINFKNNTITQAAEKPTYGLQLTCDYGNANMIINVENNTILDMGSDDALYVYETGVGESNGTVNIDTITLNGGSWVTIEP